MPKVAHDFSKEMIFYIIKCNDVEKTEIYIGSTFNFTNRKYQHKSDCNNSKSSHYNLKQYVYVRENGGWTNFTMTMLDRKICVDMLEARKHEQALITQYKAELNTNKAFGAETQLEYRIKYKDKIAEKGRQYYIENLEKIKDQQYQYRINHSDKLKTKDKQYYTKNADKFKEKIECKCGTVCCRRAMTQHIKTKKHQDFLATKESVTVL